MAAATIPTYDLYGRPAGWAGPEPLFCESLEQSNRIYMRDSRIPTHRHLNLFQFFCFTGRSGIVIELDGEHHRVRPPAALLVAPLSVHGFTFAPDSDGYILTCPESALGEFLAVGGADAEQLSRSSLIAADSGADFERLVGDFALLLEEFSADQPARIQGLRARALPIVLWFMRSLIRASGPPASNGEDRGAELVARFLGLVNGYYREQRPLSFYADELGVSSTHLNRLTRQRIGKTASATICERVLLEAQRELAYTNRRVSSNFNPNRLHPILKTKRPHRGVDYAASRGTPVKAAGDGRIIHRGRKGGYGNTVIIQHGGNVTTLYAHLSKFRKGQKNGSRVKQGQVIGYVGATGLATAPHLHYEYRLNGVHRNPRTVPLPAADPVPAAYREQFAEATRPLLETLDAISPTRLAAGPETLAANDRQPAMESP